MAHFIRAGLLITSLFLIVLTGCEDAEKIDGDYTGKEITYQLFSSTDYGNDGNITFKEKKDGSLQIDISLVNTQEGGVHPAHLHHGPLSDDNPLAAMLEPVLGETGKSQTILSELGDGIKFTYEDLLQFDGSVKVHLDNGQFKHIVIAGGNIGINKTSEAGIKSCTDFSIEN